MSFRTLLTDRQADGAIVSRTAELDEARLPEGEVLVAVEWSGLNYKDALCLTGRGGLVRTYPHIGGIDFAGRVVSSSDARYHPGQAVVLTGWRVGELHWGGYAQRARVRADWLVPLPKRWVVERTFAWLNKRRAIRTRWTKKACNWFALLQFACAHILFDMAIYG